MLKMSWQTDVIAVWKRESDGLELHLRRDGKTFWIKPLSRKLKKGEAREAVDTKWHAVEIQGINEWVETADGKGFVRVEP